MDAADIVEMIKTHDFFHVHPVSIPSKVSGPYHAYSSSLPSEDRLCHEDNEAFSYLVECLVRPSAQLLAQSVFQTTFIALF